MSTCASQKFPEMWGLAGRWFSCGRLIKSAEPSPETLQCPSILVMVGIEALGAAGLISLTLMRSHW